MSRHALFATATEKFAENLVAVCGCGKVFVPDDKTEYVEYQGKNYACCSHACHGWR